MAQPYIGIHDADGVQLLPLLVEPQTDPILVEKFEPDPPEARGQSSSRSQSSGTTDRSKFTGGASATLEGTFIGDDDAPPWAYADKLKRLSRVASRVYFHVQRADWDQPRRLLVRGEQPTSTYSDLQPGFQFQYKAPAGMWEAVAEQSVPIFPAGVEGAGFAEPISEPFFTEPGGSAGGLQFTVDGTEDCAPIVDLYGPSQGVVAITYLQTGEVWQSRTTSNVEAGHFWRIDFDNHTVCVDGDLSLSRIDQFDFLNSDWWQLQPGPAEVALTVQFPGPGCQARLRFRPRYAI